MKNIIKFNLNLQFFIVFLFMLIVSLQINTNPVFGATCSDYGAIYSCIATNAVPNNYFCVIATGLCSTNQSCCRLNATEASTQPANSNPSTPAGTVSLTNPLTGTTGSIEIPVLLGKIIGYVMGIIGSLALVMFIFGGATWMLSGGNQEKVTQGKQIIIWAALGLAIIFTAYALVTFVINTIAPTP